MEVGRVMTGTPPSMQCLDSSTVLFSVSVHVPIMTPDEYCRVYPDCRSELFNRPSRSLVIPALLRYHGLQKERVVSQRCGKAGCASKGKMDPCSGSAVVYGVQYNK